MGLDIFFLEDIRNALLAANEASSATAEAATSQSVRTLDLIAGKLREELPEDTSRILLDALHAAAVGNVNTLKYYRRGYKAALTTIALAFGIAPQAITLRLFDCAQDRPPEELDEQAGTVRIPASFAAAREP